MKRVVIIGAGAAGLMAAITAAENKETKVTLFEKNERPARKLMITGKGRCNVTNNCDIDVFLANVPQNARFLYSAFNSFSSRDTMSFFEKLNVPLKTERGNRVFPVSDKAVDIVDALVKAAKKSGVRFVFSEVKEVCFEDGRITGIELRDGSFSEADSVIVATGGLSYPLTGSTGDGYRFARETGHNVTELKPSLVPIVCHEGFCERLSGLSLKNVKLSLFCEGKKKPVFEELGEMLFTHFGISGPLVLSASAHIRDTQKSSYYVLLDLKPGLTEKQLDSRILRDFAELGNKDFSNSLIKLLPKSLIPVIVSLSGIEPSAKVNQIKAEERQRLCALLKHLRLNVTGLRPVEEAIITSGGVSVKQINPTTMESKLVKGLYFAGEVIDADAYTGGFNLQIAFSTGYLAGKNAQKG